MVADAYTVAHDGGRILRGGQDFAGSLNRSTIFDRGRDEIDSDENNYTARKIHDLTLLEKTWLEILVNPPCGEADKNSPDESEDHSLRHYTLP